jgi:hypothetical protein
VDGHWLPRHRYRHRKQVPVVTTASFMLFILTAFLFKCVPIFVGSSLAVTQWPQRNLAGFPFFSFFGSCACSRHLKTGLVGRHD